MNLADLFDDQTAGEVSGAWDLSFITGAFWPLAFALAIAAAALYALPTLIAFHRRHPNRWAILIVNAIFGATGIFWLGSLLWALGLIFSPQRPVGVADQPHLDPLPSSASRPSGPVTLPSSTPFDDVADGAADTSDPLAEIARLQALRAAGYLAEEEFNCLKRAAIARWRLAA